MVSCPNWAEEIFTDKELDEISSGDGWSVGIVVDPKTETESKALIEHFDARFPGEARAYFFDEETEEYVYETEQDYTDAESDASYYVRKYTGGQHATST